jgi:AcrR family transcriptional regulator
MDSDILFLTESRPTRADALKNRALLLETAQRLFEAQGVDAVSMSAIAEAAGVGKGTLYRHFTNKAELCYALLDHDQRALQERTFAYLRGGDSPVTKLRWFARQVLGFVLNAREWLALGASHESSGVLEHPAHLWWRQTIYGLLTQIDVSGDREYKADMLYIMLSPQSVEFQLTHLGYSRERIERGIDAVIDQIIQ